MEIAGARIWSSGFGGQVLVRQVLKGATSPCARYFGNFDPENWDSEASTWGGVKEGLYGGQFSAFLPF